MKIALIGKSGSVNHWLEDAAASLRATGHQVGVGIVRRAWLNARLEDAASESLATALARRVARQSPDLILAIGGFHAPVAFLKRLAALRGRPPLAGWVGDIFDEGAREAARLYDVVAYTDSGLLARHGQLAFGSRALFLPHAAASTLRPPEHDRRDRMVFVANATPGRRAIVEAIAAPIVVRGTGWTAVGGGHDVRAGRVPHGRVAAVYARHLAALNVRNEYNVLDGLNQRSFDPYRSATPVVTDAQADLERCFEPGTEALVWRDPDELNDIHVRLRRDPEEARRVGEAGRRRVLAEHTYAHRLAALRSAL